MDSPQPTRDDPLQILDEIITRLDRLEENQAALEGAIRAFIVVFGVRRLPDRAGERGPHEATSSGE